MNYYINNVIDKPWNNHLLLRIFVYADNNADVATIKNAIGQLNPRFRNIFDVFQLKNMTEFDVETHMYQYLKAQPFIEHTDSMRAKFLSQYRLVSYSTKKWIKSKLNSEQ
jgi:hypothetical protein